MSIEASLPTFLSKNLYCPTHFPNVFLCIPACPDIKYQNALRILADVKSVKMIFVSKKWGQSDQNGIKRDSLIRKRLFFLSGAGCEVRINGTVFN